ncbi:hypothetical protein AAC387_Pa03g1348 [Persea americana]
MAIHKGQESCLPHNLPNDLILAARVRMKNQEAYTQMFGPGLFDSPQALGSSIDGTSHIAIQANQDGSGPQIQGDHVISKQQYMRHNTSDLRALKPTNNDSAVPYSSPNQTWVDPSLHFIMIMSILSSHICMLVSPLCNVKLWKIIHRDLCLLEGTISLHGLLNLFEPKPVENRNLKFVQPDGFSDYDFECAREDVEAANNMWGTSLVGHVICKEPKFVAVRNSMYKAWQIPFIG